MIKSILRRPTADFDKVTKQEAKTEIVDNVNNVNNVDKEKNKNKEKKEKSSEKSSDESEIEQARQTAKQVAEQAVANSELYNDLPMDSSITIENNVPLMLADPTYQPLYNQIFIDTFRNTDKNIQLFGPIGTGKLESVVRAIWARHQLESQARFVLVCATNESVIYAHAYVSQRLIGQYSLQGVALTSPSNTDNRLTDLLICSYATLANQYLDASQIYHLIFLDAELICAPTHNIIAAEKKRISPQTRWSGTRVYTIKRKHHSNGSIIAEPPSYHMLFGDICSKLHNIKTRCVFVANHRIDQTHKLNLSTPMVNIGPPALSSSTFCQNHHWFVAIDTTDAADSRDSYLLQLLAEKQASPQVLIFAKIENFYRLELLFQANGVQATFLSHYNSNSNTIAHFCSLGTCRVLVVTERHCRLPFAHASLLPHTIINYDTPSLVNYISSCVRISNTSCMYVYTLIDEPQFYAHYDEQVSRKLSYARTEHVHSLLHINHQY